MGLFNRKKDSKAAQPQAPAADAASTISNGSVKPVKPAANGTTMAKPQIPDIPLPRAPDPALDPAGYLRSVHAVRERSRLVLDKAKKNQLKHFTVDMTKFNDTAAYVVSIIKVGSVRPVPLSR